MRSASAYRRRVPGLLAPETRRSSARRRSAACDLHRGSPRARRPRARRCPLGRASSTPASSKASRIAPIWIARCTGSASAPRQRARRAGSSSIAATLPPGKTSAPDAKSIWWWRTTMKISRPASPSRSRTIVPLGTGVGASFKCSLPIGAGAPRAGRGAIVRAAPVPRRVARFPRCLPDLAGLSVRQPPSESDRGRGAWRHLHRA